MKKILLAINCLLTGILVNAQSPSFEWAKNIGGITGSAFGASVIVDNSGNIYTTGGFQGKVDFDPGPGTFYLSAVNYNDIFVSKVDASGNFVWAKQMGGTSGESGSSIAVDGSGNLIITGSFPGTIDFDPGPGIFNLTAVGNVDIFICKLDGAGNFIWAKKAGGSFGDIAKSVKADALGNSYIAGYFGGFADFDPGAGQFNMGPVGSDDIFILKLDATGNFVWAKQMGGTAGDQAWALSLDGSGNIYTTGYFSGTCDFDPGAVVFNLTSAGGQEVFISKLDAAGNFVWAKNIGGVSNDLGYSITTDGSGNVYSTGLFNGTGDFDPGAGVFNLTSAGGDDIFISKLDGSGNFVWAKNMGGTGQDRGFSITADGSGNVYSTGSFYDNADFDPGQGTFNLYGYYDIFISKLDALGNFVWAKSIGESGGTDNGNAIVSDASGNIYTTGVFARVVDFDPGIGTSNLTALGSAGGEFISKLNAVGNFVWAVSAGTSVNTTSTSIATDASGNTYITGYFYGTADFDPGAGTFNLTSLPTDIWGDIFILKLDASGNFVWAKQIGGAYDDYANAIAVDTSGNIYLTGNFYLTVDFDPGPGIFNLTTTGNRDIFILKLNSVGNFVWAKNVGGIGDDKGYGIALDNSGNIYTTGYFYGTSDFDPGAGTFNLSTAGSIDIFILKLDAGGNFLWAKNMRGTDSDYGLSITTDISGNVYSTGYFGGTADFDPSAATFNLTAIGNVDMFISKLDVSGNFVWAKLIGGSSYEQGYSVATDGSGNVYTTGIFEGTVDFDPGAATFNLTSAGSYDFFISKLNASGNFVWTKQFGGTGGDFGQSIKTDASGNIYCTGYFNAALDFDPSPATFNLTPAGSYDVFILKLNTSGNLVWANQLGGITSDQGSAIAINGTDIYTTGTFTGTADFDPGAGTYNVTPYGNPDVFVHKMSQCTLPGASITPSGTTAFCSGSFVILNANTGAGLNYQWKLNTADISGATNSTYTATAAGSYTVVLTNLCGTATSSATTVTVNPLPSVTVTPVGPTTFCSGGSVVLNAPVTSNRSYQWKKGANLISSATLSSYTATTGGNYRVIVTNTVTGCSKTTGSATVVTVNALPTATITPQGPTTFCAGGSVVLAANTGTGLTYKWKKGSNFISGASLSNYTATIGGTYKVEVTNSIGCSKLSAGVVVSVPCKLDGSETVPIAIGIDVQVYPNPSSGDFVFEIQNENAKKVSISIYDVIGRMISSDDMFDWQFTIYNSQLTPGIYSAVVIQGEYKKVIRLVKNP
jgi:hypothetical protein